MIYFVYVWCVIVFLVMVPKYVIDVSIIWLNDNIYSRNTWFPTTDVQTQNIGKPRYVNRRAPTECRHTVATQATEYQRWRDVSCRSRRCRPMPTLGQRRNASWETNYDALMTHHTTENWEWTVTGLSKSSDLEYTEEEADAHIDGLVQVRRNSIALAMKLRLSCINPLIWM